MLKGLPVTTETNGNNLTGRVGYDTGVMTEGRLTMGNRGWIFVLWGVATYVATAWYILGGHQHWVWPVTMACTFILARMIRRRQRRDEPDTAVVRAIHGIWLGTAVSLLVFFVSIQLGPNDVPANVQLAAMAAMLGMSNAACGVLLKWRQQLACALIWWASAAVCGSSAPAIAMICFLVASFFCWIVFGIYAIVVEARLRDQQGATHA